MGLGSLLLDADQAAARLRGGRVQEEARPGPPPSARRAARAAAPPRARAAGGGGTADPTPPEEEETAEFVILWPALGCPELVHPIENILEIVFLSRQELDEVTGDTARSLIRKTRVLQWDHAREPYVKDDALKGKPWKPLGLTLDHYVDDATVRIREKLGLEAYRSLSRERPQALSELFHNIADVVPGVYIAAGFDTIACAVMKLQDPLASGLRTGAMYTLYYPQENGLLREILDNDDEFLEKPYDDVPLITDGSKVRMGGSNQVFRGRARKALQEEREHLVRLFHPFWLVSLSNAEYLTVAHLTDHHTSTLWDFFDRKIYPNFDQDGTSLTSGRDPTNKLDFAPAFEQTARRFNNPNLNMRSLTQLLNQRKGAGFVDLILATGDLIDFNRGFNHDAEHDPDTDYVYNLNWIRFYELLLLDYERPIFTSLGNHDWRLNPYPPRVQAETAHRLLLSYLILVCAGVGLVSGLVYGVLEGAQGPDSDSAVSITLLQLFLVPPAAWLACYPFIFLLGGIGLNLDLTFDFAVSPTGLLYLFTVFSLLGLFLTVIFLLVNLKEENPIQDASSGALWGTVLGASTGLVGAIILFIVTFFKRVDYMGHIVNLFIQEDFIPLFGDIDNDKHVAYLRAFNRDGLLYTTERSFDWYALVINPFLDYTFRFGNMSFLMIDWAGSEILPSDPPVSDDEFTARQWALVRRWIERAVQRRKDLSAQNLPADKKQVVALIGLHTPVFCPLLEVDLDELGTTASEFDARNLTRGTMEEHRDDLITALFQLGHGHHAGTTEPISAISLTGHTHTYDIFRLTDPTPEKKDPDTLLWFQSNQFAQQPSGSWDTGIHITTACAGPPADGQSPGGNAAEQAEARQKAKPLLPDFDKAFDSSFGVRANLETYYEQGNRVVRPSGCRVITFDRQTGRILKIEEVSAPSCQWGDV